MLIFAIILSIILIGVAIFLIYRFTQKKYSNFVLQNSIGLRQIREINSRYSFYPYINYNQTHTYDNENLYNNVSCTDFLIYQLQYIGEKVCSQICKLNKNKQQYENYLSEVKSTIQFGQFASSIGKLKIDKLIKIEKALIRSKTYSAPNMQFSLSVTLHRSDIKGRVYATKRETFVANDILPLIIRLNNKTGNYYNDKEIWNALCRVERAKVSNKMRFSIYKRDGYRCCKCGISERYVQLEIDHIVPISRGGKSTYDNLQTLCHKCNVEKGDSSIKYR